MWRQSFLAHDALDIFHHHDGVIHQQADHQHQREKGERVDGIAEDGQDAEGAQQHHRHRNGRHQGGAPVLQEDVHHQHHQADRLNQGDDHLADGQPDEIGVVDWIDQFHAGRQGVTHAVGPRFDRVDGLERIGARRQHDGGARRRLAVEQALDGVGIRAQFDPGDIAQMHHRARRIGLDDDVAELFGRLQLRLRRDGGVQFGAWDGRLGAQRAGGHLGVLRLDGIGNVRWHQAEIVQLVGVHPDAHGILRAEHLHRADTGDAAERVHHLRRNKVGNVDIVVAVAFVVNRDDQDVVGRRLGDGDALLLHLGRQLRNCLLHLVLNLHLGDVGICAGREGGSDRHRTVGVGRGREIQKMVEAGELLFDHLGDRILQGFGVGAGIECIHHHRGRGDDGILLDRQAEGGDAARQHDDNGDDPGEDRAINEEAGKPHICLAYFTF